MVQHYRHVEVEVCVHAQDRLDLGVRPLGADHRHVISSFRCRQQLPPDEQERTDDTVTSHAEASSYEVTTLLRPRAAVGRHQGVRPTSHLQGTLRAHVEGGSGRSEESPTAILQDTHSVEGIFEGLYSFVGEGWEQEDDITLLTLERSAT